MPGENCRSFSLSDDIEAAIESQRKERKAMGQKAYLSRAKKIAAYDIPLNKQGERLSLKMKHPPSAQQLQKIENNIVAALLNMATNTGQGRFPLNDLLYREFDRLAEEGVDPLVVPEHLNEHVDEIVNDVTTEDWSRIARKYQEEISLDAELITCACCGIRAFEMGDVECIGAYLSELDVLQYTDDQKQALLEVEKDEFRYVYIILHMEK